MPKAKKKKYAVGNEGDGQTQSPKGEQIAPPSSPPTSPAKCKAPLERGAAPSSPGAAAVSGLRAEKRKAVQAEAAAYRLLAAARNVFELKDRVLAALMRNVSRAMKQKGFSFYRDSYWARRLDTAQEKWWAARLKKEESLRDVAVCTARRLNAQLAIERAKIRSIRRRLRRRHVFGVMRWL